MMLDSGGGGGSGDLVLNGCVGTKPFVLGEERHNTSVLRDGRWRLRGWRTLVTQGCRRGLLTGNILSRNEKTGQPAHPSVFQTASASTLKYLSRDLRALIESGEPINSPAPLILRSSDPTSTPAGPCLQLKSRLWLSRHPPSTPN